MTFIIFNSIAFRSEDGTAWNLAQPQLKMSLTTIPARLFTYLLENADKIIVREELLNNIWDKYGLEPSNNSVNQYISLIRKVLVELGCEEEIIQTLPRVGFFIAGGKVSQTDEVKAESVPAPSLEPMHTTHYRRSIALLIIGIAVTIFLFIQPFSRILSTMDYQFPTSRLYEIGSIADCPVYGLNPIPQEIAKHKEQLARNFASAKLACVTDAVFIFQSSEGVVHEKSGRIFLTRCIQSGENSSILSDCKAIYDFLE